MNKGWGDFEGLEIPPVTREDVKAFAANPPVTLLGIPVVFTEASKRPNGGMSDQKPLDEEWIDQPRIEPVVIGGTRIPVSNVQDREGDIEDCLDIWRGVGGDGESE
jgi:hypothetical protein